MKRKLALLLALVMLVGTLAGCQSMQQADDTEAPKATQSPEEQAALKILTIGNSHSLDATNLLWEVFKTEAPDQKVVIGTLYVSGCRMDSHAQYVTNNEAVYDYYKNEDGTWNVLEASTVKYALEDEQWDVVVLQEMNTYTGLDERYTDGHIETVVAHVIENQEIIPALAWHMVWTNPTEEAFFQPGQKAMDMPNQNWYDSYKSNYDLDQHKMYDMVTHCTEQHIGRNEAFTYVIPSCTAIQYANDYLYVDGAELTDHELYRDYTHLSDFSRVLVSYLWYAQLSGLSAISDVNYKVVPADMRQSSFRKYGDLELNVEQQNVIVQAVNYTLANPYELPEA